ncbi:hypothetical protein RZ760_001180 [Providencia rettgeri]|nr:hypothetical protein [Providencia rettgeri]
MKGLVQLISLMALLSFVPIIVNAKTVYNIDRISPEGVLTLSMLLPTKDIDQKLVVRGGDWGLKPQIDSVQCEGILLQQITTYEWLLPKGCQQVIWSVTPTDVRYGDADASKQSTIFIVNADDNKKTILLSEPTSLLRIVNDNAGTISSSPEVKMYGAKADGRQSWSVPEYNKAPEFYLVGDFTVQESYFGNMNSHYFSDNVTLTSELKLNQYHQEVLGYLTKALSITPQESGDNELLVIWLGSNEKNKFIGGAAGGRSFVANYLYGDDNNIQLNNAKTQLVMAHEQFHQLIDMIRGNKPSQPTWIEEGLAQYYGFKSLKQTENNPELVSQIGNVVVPSNVSVKHTFMALDKQFKAGDRSVYPEFYSQGAIFWHKLDSILSEAAKNHSGLDPFVVELMTSPPEENGDLPEKIKTKMIEIGGEPVNSLFQQYIGQ